MKTLVNKFLSNTQDSVEELYSSVVSVNKNHKNMLPKHMYKDITKLVNKTLKNVNCNTTFFNYDINPNIPNLFIRGLGVSIGSDELNINQLDLKEFNLKLLLQDKEFYNYFKNIVFQVTTHRYMNFKLQGINERDVFEETDGFPYYYKDVKSIVISYFFLTEKNVTTKKLRNVMSIFLKDGDIDIVNLSDRETQILEQLRTGIKYKKEKDRSSNNSSYRERTKKFNFLQYVSTRIVVKYISNKEYKHRFHKSPIEHERSGHWRHYSSGKKIWINNTIINLGMVD